MFQVRARVTMNNTRNVIRVLDRQENDLAENLAHFVRGAARSAVPVDLGHLRRSIRVSRRSQGHYVVSAKSKEGGAPRDYAHYVEHGTRYHRAQPYMRPAYETMLRAGLPAEAAELRALIYQAAARR